MERNSRKLQRSCLKSLDKFNPHLQERVHKHDRDWLLGLCSVGNKVWGNVGFLTHKCRDFNEYSRFFIEISGMLFLLSSIIVVPP